MIDMRKAVFDFSFLDCLLDDYLKCAWSINQILIKLFLILEYILAWLFFLS